MNVDRKKLANIIYRLGAKGDVPESLWEEMADLAEGPAASREIIMGLVGVSVAVLRRYDAFPKGKFVSLQIESDEPAFVTTYQMVTAALNDDMDICWALATSAVNQGMEWADEVMFSAAIACRYISRDYLEGGGIVVEDDPDEEGEP